MSWLLYGAILLNGLIPNSAQQTIEKYAQQGALWRFKGSVPKAAVVDFANPTISVLVERDGHYYGGGGEVSPMVQKTTLFDVEKSSVSPVTDSNLFVFVEDIGRKPHIVVSCLTQTESPFLPERLWIWEMFTQ